MSRSLWKGPFIDKNLIHQLRSKKKKTKNEIKEFKYNTAFCWKNY